MSDENLIIDDLVFGIFVCVRFEFMDGIVFIYDWFVGMVMVDGVEFEFMVEGIIFDEVLWLFFCLWDIVV